MEITAHALWTPIHGMVFGGSDRLVRIYLTTMVVLAWAAVLSGAYAIYPWYRAAPPPRTVNRSGFPQRLLMSSPATIGWHSLGMERKEHVAWFAPISIIMVAFVFIRYGRDLSNHRQLRAAMLVFTLASLVAAGIAVSSAQRSMITHRFRAATPSN